MNKNGVKAIKSGFWYTVSNFLISASALITTPIFTRLLSQDQYGMYNNYTSWQSILLILCTFNIQASLISARYDYEDNLDEYIFSVLCMSGLSVLLWTVLLNLFSGWAQNFFDLSITYINLMMAYIFCFKVFEMFQVKQRYYYKYKLQVGLSLLSTMASAGLSILLVLCCRDKLGGRITGSVLPTIVIGISSFAYFMVKGRHFKLEFWKYALLICLPYVPHLLSMTVLGSTDRIMITKMCGATDTALYSLAYSCGMIISVFLNSVNTAFSPWLAEKLHENDPQSVRTFSRFYIGIFLFVAVGFMMLAPEVLWILGGEDYLPAMYVMPPVTMGCICQFFYTMMVNIEQIKRKTLGMAIASVMAALINYGLNLIMIPRYGYIAAAYTTLVGYFFLLIFHMLLVARMKMTAVYDFRLIFISVLCAAVFMIGITALYRAPLIRYSVVLIYIASTMTVLYLKRGKILDLLKKLKGNS